MPIKVFDLAKELKKSNTEMIAVLRQMGMASLTPTSDLDDDTAGRIRAEVSAGSNVNGGGDAATAAKAANEAGAAGGASGDPVEVPQNITIKDLAERLGIGPADIQKVLMNMGVLAALNQRLAPDAVNRIAQKLGRTVRTAAAPAPAAPAAPAGGAGGTGGGAGGATAQQPRGTGTGSAKGPGTRTTSMKRTAGGGSAQSMTPRPPVVTIMGHVDHGKTTLLDALRKTDVAGGEAGGITQHIGAYQIEVGGQRITFLDTPGHAAFSAMRARGASVTDIVVIVVAADDGVMPQTVEAIEKAKEAGVPIIVAVNKIDKEGANPDRVLTELTEHDIVPEAYGGDVQTVNISAKTGENLDALISTIVLVSEVVVDPKADPHAPVQGTIIEAKLDKGRGAVSTVLVQQGTLRVGDVVVAGSTFGKIRLMSDERGNKLVKAGPSSPVEIIGLNAVPEAGDRLEVAKNEKEAREMARRRGDVLRDERLGTGSKMSLEALYQQLRTGPVKELNVVIKGDVQGSVQAVRDSLEALGNEEVRVRVLSASVGPVSESDVLLAAADKEATELNSLIVGFNVGTAGGVEKKAEQEHVQIKSYSIIYELIDDVKDAMIALLPPIYEENNLGKAEVRALFKLPGGRAIAGCYVLDGLIRRNAKARLYRGKDLLYTGDIDTLKRFKDDQREVAAGYECGLTLGGFNEIREGDVIECFELRQVPREL